MTRTTVFTDVVLADPVLDLHGPDGALLMRNDNWRDGQPGEVEGTVFQPESERESVIVTTLNPGAYTAILTGKNGAIGIGMVEVYDGAPHTKPEFTNISTRGDVEAGDGRMIGGFILGPTGRTRVVLRGLGPSLQNRNVSDILTDPVLDLRNGQGDRLATNDNWTDDVAQALELISLGIQPPNTNEAALAVTLPAGGYTLILSGKNGGTGNGLVEVFNLRR